MVSGAGTELYRGVGAIVLFGILGAAFVSLTMLPALTVSVLKYPGSMNLCSWILKVPLTISP